MKLAHRRCLLIMCSFCALCVRSRQNGNYIPPFEGIMLFGIERVENVWACSSTLH